MQTAHEVPRKETLTDRSQIKAALDALVNGSCGADAFDAAMITRCRDNPDAVWELLALIDQYGRRGQLGTYDVSALKAKISRETYGQSLPAKGSTVKADAAGIEIAPPSNTASVRSKRPVLLNEKLRPATLKSAVIDEADEARDATEIVAASPIPPPVARLAYSRVRKSEASVSPVAAPKPRETRYPAVGSVLHDRFVLEERLGSGGMGTVFKALDRNRLGLPAADRHVALKVLREELTTRPEAVHCLTQEFLQTQHLSHPGVINVFDLGTDGGHPYITMELLEGELLSSVLARTAPLRLERRDADSILSELGSALAYAHERGIVHADIKPSNIMITERGGLRILDFGAATLLKSEPWISEPGQSFNAVTLAYASCERLAGETPDVRDDIFSYACVAYELLAGMHPFGRKSAVEARAQRIPLRPIPGLTRRQWRALAKGLAWDRSMRQENLAAVLRDLVPDVEYGRLPPPRLLQSRTAAFSGTSKTGWIVAAGALAMLAIVVAALPVASMPPEVERARQELIRMRDVAAGLTQSWIGKVGEWRTRAPFVKALMSEPESQPQPQALTVAPSSQIAQEQIAREQIEAVQNQSPQGQTSESPLVASVTTIEEAGSTAEPAVPPAAIVDRGPGRLELEADTLSVAESSPVARVIVHRRGGIGRSATFSWHTMPGSATENLDYAAFGPVTETFAPGQSTASILVPIVRDSDPEGAETFSIEITLTDGQSRLGSLTATTVFIEDDDTVPVTRR